MISLDRKSLVQHASKAVLILGALISIICAAIGPVRHDYQHYLTQWEAIRLGHSSYDIDFRNAYGVVHNFFAYLDVSDFVHLPRMIFIGALITAGSILLRYSVFVNKSMTIWLPFLLVINPIIWQHGVFFGSNDVLIAALTLISVVFFDQKKFTLSGGIMGIAIAYKFIPIFIVPFMVIQNRKIVLKFLIPLMTTVLVVYTAGFLIWDHEIWKPFFFGKNRAPKHLSIFTFLSSQYSPLGFRWGKFAASYSMHFIALNGLVCFALYFFKNLNWKLISFGCLFNVLILYKVGHHQFYLTPFLLFLYFWITEHHIIQKYNWLTKAAFLFWLWLTFTEILMFGGSLRGHGIEYHALLSVPTFLLQLLLSTALFKTIFIEKNQNYSMPQP